MRPMQPMWSSLDFLLQTPVTQSGELWQLGAHRIICGDAREPATLERLMDREKAAMAFLDPPYNVTHAGHCRARPGSSTRNSPWRLAKCHRLNSLPSSPRFCGAAAAVSENGAVHFVCMDWRHIGELLTAGSRSTARCSISRSGSRTNAGQGSFYRSQHELVAVFRVGEAPHLNNIELGRHGRNRSNVWHYAGVNTFRAGRMDELTRIRP